jgi:hypothetical protein
MDFKRKEQASLTARKPAIKHSARRAETLQTISF